MGKKNVTVCDGCGKVLKPKSESYRLDLKTDSFWDGVEMTECRLNLDFCKSCAIDIMNSLKKIIESVKCKED